MTHEFAHVLSVKRGDIFDPKMKRFWGKMTRIRRRYNARMKKIMQIDYIDVRRETFQREYLGDYAGTKPD